MPEPEDEPSDEALVARMKTGDESAVEVLIGRYERPLFGYLNRLLGNAAEAEDVFQETFLRVVRHVARFEEGRRVRPWVYAIASNLVKNVYRSRSYRDKTSLDQGAEDGEPLGARLAGVAVAPAEAASENERAVVIRAAVERLTPTSRDALVLFYFQGLAYEEIAQVLEVPLGTVKSRIHNALAKLAGLLGPAAARTEANHGRED